MIYYLLITSIISLVLVYFFYLKKIKIKKNINYFIIFFPTVLSVLVIFHAFNLVKPIDTRYVDKRIRELRHYSPWSETIYGNADSITGKIIAKEEKHEDYYTFVYVDKDKGNVREERDLPKTTYDYYTNIWDSLPSFSYQDSLGRTIEIYKWNYNNEKGNRAILTYTMTVPYINYFKNTMNLYNHKYISDKEAVELGLFLDYNSPVTINSDSILEPRQSLVYGLELEDSIDRSLNYLASFSPDFRPLLLVWSGIDKINKKDELIKAQESYWKGCKDNEIAFCVCIDSEKNRKIIWSGSFSWAESKELEQYVLNNALKPGMTLDPKTYSNTIIKAFGNNLWKPRNFEDYSFCKMPIEEFVIVLITLLIIIVNVVFSIKIIKKSYKNEEYRTND